MSLKLKRPALFLKVWTPLPHLVHNSNRFPLPASPIHHTNVSMKHLGHYIRPCSVDFQFSINTCIQNNLAYFFILYYFQHIQQMCQNSSAQRDCTLIKILTDINQCLTKPDNRCLTDINRYYILLLYISSVSHP